MRLGSISVNGEWVTGARSLYVGRLYDVMQGSQGVWLLPIPWRPRATKFYPDLDTALVAIRMKLS